MAVEEGVDVGAKKEAVVDIEAFSIGFAFRPGFGVAGAKDFGISMPKRAQQPPQ